MSILGAMGNIFKAYEQEENLSLFSTVFDYLVCRKKYCIGSDQYVKERFWSLSEDERREHGMNYLSKATWVKNDYVNRKFLHTWMSSRWNCTRKRNRKRINAYIRFYHMGHNCHIGNSVEISRRHYLDGTLKIGNYVNFAQNIYLDYSGDVVIEDYVVLTDGVHILTHDHRFQHEAKTKYDFDEDAIKGNLEICYGAMIGAKAIITPTCHRIGRFSRIGAGAVVTHDVPDYAVVAGVPAKVIRYFDNSIDKNKQEKNI